MKQTKYAIPVEQKVPQNGTHFIKIIRNIVDKGSMFSISLLQPIVSGLFGVWGFLKVFTFNGRALKNIVQ